MQPERFTTKAQEAVQAAQRIAREYSQQEIDGEHLLAALLAQEDGLIQPLLQKLGVPVARLSADLDQALAPAAARSREPVPRTPFLAIP